MKLRLALVGLVALGGAALSAGMASAMPIAPLSPASNVESVAVVCGPNGCSARGPSTDDMATAFVAMAMCVQPTDTAGSIAVGNWMA
jgi:sugar/nucleoside kinase (ribokinase family)